MQTTLRLNKHILIVEDDEECRLLLELMLKNLGCSFESAVNGQEAMDKVRLQKFDVVLLDVWMPVMHGYETAKQIRKLYHELPIIVLTAYAMTLIEAKFKECGMNDYLIKPFKQEELVEKLQRWTSKGI